MTRCVKYKLPRRRPVIAVALLLIPVLVYNLQTEVYLSDLKITHLMDRVGRPDSPTIEIYDAETELDNFKELVRPYLEELERARDIFRELAPHRNFSITKITSTAKASDENYFDNLAKHTEIQTLFLRRPLSMIRSSVRQEYYQYGSSDCETLGKAPYGKRFSRATFNKTCQEDLERLIEPVPLELSHFKLGLPKGFNYSSSNVTLTFLSIVPNAVVQPTGDVRYKNLRIVPQRCGQDKLQHSGARKRIYEEVLTVAQLWGEGFYHGVVEDLPRLAPYIEFLKSHPSIYIHVASRMSFMVKFMNVLGISSQRLVSGTIKAEILYLPAGGPCGRGTLFSTQMLSAYMRNTRHNQPAFNQGQSLHNMTEIVSESGSLPKSSIESNATRNTVILQKRSAKRYFSNNNAIANAIKHEAETRGLQMVVFSDKDLPSLKETIELYDSAVLVVAPHGAGESNMLFARPGTPLIEGLCEHLVLCYRNLMQNLGLRYYGIIPPDTDCIGLQPRHLLPAVIFFLDNLLE